MILIKTNRCNDEDIRKMRSDLDKLETNVQIVYENIGDRFDEFEKKVEDGN